MSTAIRFFLVLAFSIFLAVGAESQVAGKEVNIVEIEIVKNGRVIGKPRIVMEVGSVALTTSTNRDGFSLRTRLSRSDADVNQRNLMFDLYIVDRGNWALIATPSLTGLLDRDMSISTNRAGVGAITLKAKVSNSSRPIAANNLGQNICSDRQLATWEAQMARPVSESIVKASAQLYPDDNPGRCCSPCSGVQCCGSGPTCCSGLCPDGGGCCT